MSAERIAQNIARHATTAGALDSIVASAPHRAQLLDPSFTHVGLASVASAEGMYVTQVLAQLAPPPAELPPPSITEAPRPQPAEIPLRPTPVAPPVAPVAPPEAPAPELATAPAVEAVPVAPQTLQAPPATMQTPAQAEVQPPLMRVPSTHRRVAGYWIQHGGRWWYFPVPAHAQPGQLLQPDLTVQGPPPGYQPPRSSPTRGPAPPPPVAYPAHQAPRTAPAATIHWY